MKSSILCFLIPFSLLTACVSSKKYNSIQTDLARLDSTNKAIQERYHDCTDSAEMYRQKTVILTERLQDQRTTSDVLLNQLKDLSVISSSQAESIKRSLENIGAKDAYIQNLQSAIARKDSLNMVLVMNLKGALGNLEDTDINIKIDKGVIYIDISDKLLFKTGKYVVTERAKEVLGKVAKVLLNQPQIEFMVEGHTDTVPYRSGVLLDNWDLSVKRATSVIRILQSEYGIPPARMTAAGRGEHVPIATNNTEEGRAINRRTRIVILPELDQFFKLLESNTTS